MLVLVKDFEYYRNRNLMEQQIVPINPNIQPQKKVMKMPQDLFKESLVRSMDERSTSSEDDSFHY